MGGPPSPPYIEFSSPGGGWADPSRDRDPDPYDSLDYGEVASDPVVYPAAVPLQMVGAVVDRDARPQNYMATSRGGTESSNRLCG